PWQQTNCGAVIRYSYRGPRGTFIFQQQGIETGCTFSLSGANDVRQCADTALGTYQNPISPGVYIAPYIGTCTQPTQWISTSGQVRLDLSDLNQPVILYPDGSKEVLGHPCDPTASACTGQSGIFYKARSLFNT